MGMPARKGTHAVMTKREDTLYTKFCCFKFGLDNDSRFLGPAVCGSFSTFFCIRSEGICGLEKEDPYIKQLNSCELNAPMLECGEHYKCFPLKYLRKSSRNHLLYVAVRTSFELRASTFPMLSP